MTNTVTPRITPNTSWLIGAGASYDAIGFEDLDGRRRFCIPMTAGLTKNISTDTLELLEAAVSQASFEPPVPLAELLSSRLGQLVDFLRAQIASKDLRVGNQANSALRGLVSHIAESIRFDELRSRLPNAENEFRYCATNYLWLASKCYWFPDWSVLTLNYDLLLDRAFYEISLSDRRWSQYDTRCRLATDFTNGQKAAPLEHGAYLKLHGTLSAYECLNRDCQSYRVPFFLYQKKTPIQVLSEKSFPSFTGDLAEFARQVDESHDAVNPKYIVDYLRIGDKNCPMCRELASHLVLPPGVNETPTESAFHARVFDQARFALVQADTWIVLGYSCPDYDEDVINLLRLALDALSHKARNEQVVWVVSPDGQEVASRLSSLLNHPVGYLNIGFTELVDDALRRDGNSRPRF